MKRIHIAFLLLLVVPAAVAQIETAPGVAIHRAARPITVDGVISPDEWAGATPIERWYEFQPGNNTEPKVRTVAMLAYDSRFFYAAFICYDPDPGAVRAPYTDRDNIGEATDYAGLLVSSSGDRKTAVEFMANARGVQYDAINSDASGEDSAPDFYWDSAGRITSEGWTLEMRIPFSSLRYSSGQQDWTIMLFRNYPRDRRYKIASAPLPQGANCFVCRFPPLTGLEGLPSASHLIVAPYATATRESAPVGAPGTPLEDTTKSRAGVDVKWTPSANAAVDATINPDFSQVESDVAAITTNERFAVFYPEKRPFFLEGKDLFATPIQAVYTREINSPRWGARSTGSFGSTAYTLLVADDRGGGAIIISGPNNSSLAQADFASRNLIGRVRHDIGSSFASFLVTDREIEGGGHNRVFGPDFLWRAGENDNIRGQFLISDSRTPVRPDLAAEWTGQSFSSHAAQIEWSHSTQTIDWTLVGFDRGNQFRADLGFVPQVGTKESYGQGGYTFHPKGFFSRVRPFVEADYTGQRDGKLVYRFVQPGIEADGRWTTYGKLSVAFDRVRAGDRTIKRTPVHVEFGARPSRLIQAIDIEGRWGTDIDFANSRPGRGGSIEANAQIRPTDHLEFVLNSEYSRLDVEGGQRLFAARVERLKATYNFSSRAFLRLIGQYVRTDRDPGLYAPPLESAAEAGRTLSVLYAYKVNWQTVLYAGYGDVNELTDAGNYAAAGRQAFVKVSYAWQR